MKKDKHQAKNHAGKIIAIVTSVASAGIVLWGLLPEKKAPAKKEWIPPVKKNWYLGSDD